MEEVRLTVRVQNNRLIETRRKLKLNQAELSTLSGVPHSTISGLECLRQSPLNTKGDWTDHAFSISSALHEEPEFLFPLDLYRIKNPVVTRQLHNQDFVALTSTNEQTLIGHSETQITDTDEIDKKKIIEEVISEIETMYYQKFLRHAGNQVFYKRVRPMLEMRFGLNGNDEHTLREVAKIMGLQVERVRQLEGKALRLMRHPKYAGRLREVYGECSRKVDRWGYY